MMKKKVFIIDLKSNDAVLLITGCIKPQKNQKYLVLKDESERLKQYINSIYFYIEKSLFTNIVYCDNSGFCYSDVDKICKLAATTGKKFEWLSFVGDTEQLYQRGKGYGEGEIIEYALSSSNLLKNATVFAKVTGRLKIENINLLITKVKYNNNYFIRDIYGRCGIDTRFYMCDIRFYKSYLINGYLNVSEDEKDSKSLEDIFYEILKTKRYRSLLTFPVFDGMSGGNGRNYSIEPMKKLKIYSMLCRVNMFNTIFPIIKKLQWHIKHL